MSIRLFRCFVTTSPSDLCGVVSIRGQRTVDLQLILMTVDSGVNYLETEKLLRPRDPFHFISEPLPSRL